MLLWGDGALEFVRTFVYTLQEWEPFSNLWAAASAKLQAGHCPGALAKNQLSAITQSIKEQRKRKKGRTQELK